MRAHLEHLPGALAVGAGDDGGVHVEEALLLEKGVRGRRQRVADPSNRAYSGPPEGLDSELWC